MDDMHAYRIAVDKGLIPARPKARTPLPRAVKTGRVLRRSPRERPQTPSPTTPSPKRKSSKRSLNSDPSSTPSQIFSAPSRSSPGTQITDPSTARASAGPRDSKDPTSYPTVVDRFAIDLIERSRTLNLSAGRDFWIQQRKIAESEGLEPIDFYYPALFRSIRICKTDTVGNPVHLTSEHTVPLGKRSLRVGDAVFLNNEGSGDGACHISTVAGGVGRPRFVLELSVALISQGKGRSEYTCEASMDITEMVRLLCDLLFQKYFTPQIARKPGSNAANKQHAYDDGGYWIHDIDWTEIANEASDARSLRAFWRKDDRRTIDLDIPVADPDLVEFHERIEDVRFWHRECFLLEQTAETRVWGITDRSPALHEPAAHADVAIGMSPTDAATLAQLGRNLSRKEPFNLEILWGSKAERLRVYCVPLHRNTARVACWMCFLVGSECGDLWELWHSRFWWESWRD